MKMVDVNGVSLAYDEWGSGSEAVVLSHSFLVDHRQFASQVEMLADRYRVLAYDHRGHGESSKGAADYDMEAIYADAVGFIEATGAGPCHFVGLSTGGFVGLRLGFRRPDLLKSLVLMDTSAEIEPLPKRAKYEAMFAVARRAGLKPLINRTMSIMFGSEFLNDPDRKNDVSLWRERILANDVDALVEFGRAIFGRAEVVEDLTKINIPTLVMVGEHDGPQPVARAQTIAEGIEGAVLHVIPRAGHLSTIDNPEDVNAALSSFLETGQLPSDAEAKTERSPRSVLYDGQLYGRVIEPMLAGVHSVVVEALPAGGPVLDACCGTGGLAHKIAATGREVVGVDLSPRNIDYARRAKVESSTASSTVFDTGDVAHLAHEDDSFETATIVMALHEMPAHLRVPVLRELTRVARHVLIVDFEVPMPRNASGIRNRAFELAAGKSHFGAFRDYSRRGGLRHLLEEAEVIVDSQRQIDRGTLSVCQVHR
jgi:3-oxoadipate enol-lactonase